jgi:starch synthase
MKILLVASEAVPYFKSGGLADVARALPDALLQAGHDVRIVHPYYGFVRERNLSFSARLDMDLPWPGGTAVRFHVHQPPSGAPAALLEHQFFDDVTEPYASAIDPQALGDRFALFSRAALHYARLWGAQVMHLNDWQTGLVPVYALVDGIRMPAVFSIHNLAYQGNFPPSILGRIGVPMAFYRTDNGLEFFNTASFLKGGIALADRITTVSPTYAREIQTPEFGAGLDGLLRHRADVLTGILNGIDVDNWNPATDRALKARFSPDLIFQKDTNREALLEELQLDGKGPLVVAVSRLAHQKGIDILFGALPGLLQLGASVAVLGDGDPPTERAFARATASFPRRIAALFRFDDPLSRRFYAGGDFFVMPSRYEPCGLGQMIAQRYGTVPIVRRTGGLVDTVVDGSTGFHFDVANSDALLGASVRAFSVWRTDGWLGMLRRCMRLDHSWGRSAERYVDVYRAAIG